MNVKEDVKTAGRTLDVFETFQRTKRPVTLSELADHIGAPLSSCHGLVRTLRNRGYLYSVGSRSMLYPTKRMLEVASVISANDPILEQLEPVLVSLRDETRETVILGKRQENAVVYLEVIEGLHTVRYAAQSGRLTPLHSSAIGKAMLGRMPTKVMSELIRTLDLPRVTDRTLTEPSEIEHEIAEGRERGYFVTRGENVDEVMAIATTIRAGVDWLGIAVAGPMSRMQANFGLYLERLRAACSRAETQREPA